MVETVKPNKLQWVKSNILQILCFAIYVVIVFFCVFHHETFRDEAQAWLIVRDLGFIDMLKQLCYEGHMVLWYLVLFPFAKLGFPYITLNIISALFTISAVFFILFKSPINKYVRCLLIFVTPILYFYPVISRCYSMLPLALVCVALTHQKRHERPFLYMLSLVFLANVHVFVWGLLLGFLLEFFIEYIVSIKKNGIINKDFKSMAMAAGLIIISSIPMLIAVSLNTEATKEVCSWDESFQLLFMIGIGSELAIISGLLFIIMMMLAFVIAWRETLIYLSFILFHLFVSTFFFFSNETRSVTWIGILVFMIWIYFESGRNKIPFNLKLPAIAYRSVAVSLCLIMGFFVVMNVYNSYFRVMNEYTRNFSNSKPAAEFVNSNLEDDAVLIVTNRPELGTPLVPYFDADSNVRLINYGSGEFYTFQTWDEYTYIVLDGNLEEFINDNLSECEHVYVLMTSNYKKDSVTDPDELTDYQNILSYVDEGLLTEVYTDAEYAMYYRENYAIYRVNR